MRVPVIDAPVCEMSFCSQPNASNTLSTLPTSASTLGSFLVDHHLSAFHDALLALGAAVVDDLRELSDDELTLDVEHGGLGMQPLEAKRLRRALAGHT